MPRRLLPQQPVVSVRREHRTPRGRGDVRRGAGALRVTGCRPVVLLVHEHDGRGPPRSVGRLHGRVRGRRDRDGGAGHRAHGRGRARRDARARLIRLRALFVLLAGHGEHRAAGRGAADHVHGRRAHPTDQRIRRPECRPTAVVCRPAHGRPTVRLIHPSPPSPSSPRRAIASSPPHFADHLLII